MHKISRNLQPILFLAKFLLVSPICSLNYPKIRLMSLILSILVAILQVIGYIYVAFVHFFFWNSRLVNMITHINVCIASLCTIVLSANACMYNDRFEEVLKKMVHIDCQLNWISYRDTKKHMLICFIVWVLNSIIIIIEIVANWMCKTISTEMPFMFYLVYNLTCISSGGFVIIYSTFVQFIEERFEYITKKIKHLPNIKEQLMFFATFNDLASCHLDTCELLDMINRFFSVSVFAIVAMFFVHLLTNLYMIGVIAKCAVNSNLPMASLTVSATHCLPGIFVFGLLCYRSGNATKYVCLMQFT